MNSEHAVEQVPLAEIREGDTIQDPQSGQWITVTRTHEGTTSVIHKYSDGERTATQEAGRPASPSGPGWPASRRSHHSVLEAVIADGYRHTRPSAEPGYDAPRDPVLGQWLWCGSRAASPLRPPACSLVTGSRNARPECGSGVHSGRLESGWPRRRPPGTASSREQPCRMPPQTLMSIQRVGWWPRSCRAARRCRFRLRRRRASPGGPCRSRRMRSGLYHLGCMRIRRIS